MTSASTEKIRDIVSELAFGSRAIWPNGLGFTWRGWDYSCRNPEHWVAVRNEWVGHGETPTDAKANAYRQPE